ncbi:MAG: low temperature requirement protein A [Candidatus Limnocylindria bacterium]
MTAARRPWHVQMSGRDPGEAHRAATPLELLFDLCFVVAVAQASVALHHDLADGHLVEGIVSYLMVFFAIWWAWLNFTWFASAYDTDDVLYRLLTFVQIAGVLVIAAGVARTFEGLDYVTITIGYLIVRIGLVAQWLRAAHEHGERAPTAMRYAIGVGVLQVGWLARLFLPSELAAVGFPVLVALELAVPWWAERAGMTPWHRGHMAERFGLFTIIVLGECVLAATTAIQEAITVSGLSTELVVLALGALVLIGAMWWAYFKHDAVEDRDLDQGTAFLWGYGHYVVFAAVAAVGTGLNVAADLTHEEAEIGPIVAGLIVAVPVAIYLVAAWLVTRSGRAGAIFRPVVVAVVLLLAAAVAIGPFSVPLAVLAMGLVVATLVGVSAYRASSLPV